MQQAVKNGIFALLLVAIVVGIASLLAERAEQARHAQQASGLQENVKPLSREDYQRVRDSLFSLLETEGARAALDALFAQTESDPSAAHSCHLLAHELGQKAYAKYGDFGKALSFSREMCNSGYFHGIIEARFKESGDIFAAMREVCRDYPDESFTGWECYHGVGHGLMFFTDNDLPHSLEACDTYENEFKRSNCANGVFMENFNSDQKLHKSAYLKESDPFYPCAEQTERHKPNCYFYAPEYFLHLHYSDYRAALSWCTTAEAPYQAVCVRNVAGNAIVQNAANPKGVESLCLSASREQKIPCIEGMVSLYINHFGSLEPARTLCGTLEKENQEVCQRIITLNEPLF